MKNAIVSSARTTFSVESPPGSAAKPSAISATIAKLRAALTTSRLGDGAGGRERQDEHAERDAVEHEEAQVVARHIAQQESDRPVADDERDHHGDHQLAAARVSLVAAEELAQLEQGAQKDRGCGEQERVARGGLARQAA